MADGGCSHYTCCTCASQPPSHPRARVSAMPVHVGPLSAPLISADGRPHALLALRAAIHMRLCADAYGRVEHAVCVRAAMRGVSYTHTLMWYIITELRASHTRVQSVPILHLRNRHSLRKGQAVASKKLSLHANCLYQLPFVKPVQCLRVWCTHVGMT